MISKNSPETNTYEAVLPSQTAPLNTSLKTGALINADEGYGKKIIPITGKDQFKNTFGKPNEYNYKNWFPIRDVVSGEFETLVYRALPDNAKNSSVKLRGNSKLFVSTWFNSVNNKTLDKPDAKLYNDDVATYALEETFTTDYRLEIINRYVTSKQNLAVAVCSSIEHYNESIFNNEVSVIRNFDQYIAPSSPSKFEKYIIKRATQATVSTDDGTKKIVVSGDVTSKFATGDKIVLSGTNTGTFTIATATFSTPNTEIVVTEVVVDSTNDVIHYLQGSWKTQGTFVDGSLVNYNGSAWELESVASNIPYYVELLGSAYIYNGSSWIINSDKYLPVDSDKNGKSEYAVLDIFDSSLYNSDNSLKSFSQLYKKNITFNNVDNEVIVMVFSKNDAGKWYKVETHIGSYNTTAKDSSNQPYSIDKVILRDSNRIYCKIGTKSYTSTISGSDIVSVNDLRGFQVGEKIKLKNVIKSAVKQDVIFTISAIDYLTGTTTINVSESLTGYTSDGTTLISDELSAKVSTNMNKYDNVRSADYDILNFNASWGYGVEDMLIYDTNPTNSSGASITDYSDLTEEDMNTSALVFEDKDNVNVSFLLSFQTEDEFGNKHQDKMCEIAIKREDCVAVVSPQESSLHVGLESEQIETNITREFGNSRESQFQGTFTKFSTYVACITWMRYEKDEYNDKYRWLPDTGSFVRRMLTTATNPNKGIFYPSAGVGDGELFSSKLSFIPSDKDMRDRLGNQGLITSYKNDSLTLPIIFANLTTDKSDSILSVLSYRNLINELKKYMEINLFPLYFKFKSDAIKKTIKTKIDNKLNGYVTKGGLEYANFSFFTAEFENPNELNMRLNMRFTGVLTTFNVYMNFAESGVTFTEEIV